MVLLWAKEDGYWKIVSWQVAPQPDDTPAPPAPPAPTIVQIKADVSLVPAAKDFVEAWLIRKNYDAAFRALSTRSYGCYDLERGPDAPPSASFDDAGRRIRAGLERVGEWVGRAAQPGGNRRGCEPLHPWIRAMDEPYSRTFASPASLLHLPRLPSARPAPAARCRPNTLPLEYGQAFGMTFQFYSGGEAPVLRLLWRKEADGRRVCRTRKSCPSGALQSRRGSDWGLGAVAARAPQPPTRYSGLPYLITFTGVPRQWHKNKCVRSPAGSSTGPSRSAL